MKNDAAILDSITETSTNTTIVWVDHQHTMTWDEQLNTLKLRLQAYLDRCLAEDTIIEQTRLDLMAAYAQRSLEKPVNEFTREEWENAWARYIENRDRSTEK